MNKDFWECIDKLEELAEKATQGEWSCDDSGYVFRNPQASSEEGQMPIVLLSRTFNQAKQGKFDGAFIAAANPAMILEIITEMRRLEKEADWLADEVRDLEDAPVRTRKELREAARKAVAEADNA